MSVADAVGLLGQGKLNGHAVAVAGYFNQFTPSCPYPGRYVGPLESWCRFIAFTDARGDAQLCAPMGANGTSCHQTTATNLAPYFIAETSGDVWSMLTGGATGEPAAIVLIGHAGDARQWQCTAKTQGQCAMAFVADRIAWANGQNVPASAPQIGNQETGRAVAARMSLAQVAAAIGVGGEDLLTGAALRAADVATVDPRWNLAGNGVMWLARSLGPDAASAADRTRAETVWLVDDATGKVLDSHPLKLAADYLPARLWQMATAHGVDGGSGDVLAFTRVATGDGTVVHEGMVPGGTSGTEGGTIYGGSYGSGPLVLPAGTYTVTAWFAGYAGGVAGAPRQTCSTEVTLDPHGDVTVNADFPLNQTCTFQPPPSPSAGP